MLSFLVSRYSLLSCKRNVGSKKCSFGCLQFELLSCNYHVLSRRTINTKSMENFLAFSFLESDLTTVLQFDFSFFPSGGYCLRQLLNWVKWHFTQADRLAQKVMSADDPFSHPDYWNTVRIPYF